MAPVRLLDVTRENFDACINLRVREDQRGFVAPNVYSIAQSKVYPGVQTKAIYAGETLVGFVMWGADEGENPGEMWIWRLMIEAEQQGNGYARAALEQIIRLGQASGHDALFVSYVPENSGAARLYASLGFTETGRVEDGEIVVRKDLRDPRGAALSASNR